MFDLQAEAAPQEVCVLRIVTHAADIIIQKRRLLVEHVESIESNPRVTTDRSVQDTDPVAQNEIQSGPGSDLPFWSAHRICIAALEISVRRHKDTPPLPTNTPSESEGSWIVGGIEITD